MQLEEDIEKLEKKVEKQSFAMELLEYSKEQNKQLERTNKRLIGVLCIVLLLWFATICYLIYVLNDTGTFTETATQEVKDIDSVGGNIINKGETYGDNKADSN